MEAAMSDVRLDARNRDDICAYPGSVSSPVSQMKGWRTRRAYEASRAPRPLIEREPSAWPWSTTTYLAILVVAAFAVTVPKHCAGDWTFGHTAEAGAILAPVLDVLIIGRRRNSWSLAIAVGAAALATCLAVLWLVVMLRGGAAHCFD
jgi:hypothetical protein